LFLEVDATTSYMNYYGRRTHCVVDGTEFRELSTDKTTLFMQLPISIVFVVVIIRTEGDLCGITGGGWGKRVGRPFEAHMFSPGVRGLGPVTLTE
jgi:hypothetical protein